MVLDAARPPLRLASLVVPTPAPHQVLIRVHACAVCRTDLHVVDGELAEPKLPLVPGHEIVGSVAALGDGVDRFAIGDRVGVPWLGWTCGECEFCRSRPREPVRAGTLHRLSDRWRLRRIHRRRSALLLRHPRRLQRHRGRAAALRRPDRLPLAAHGRRGAAARPVRLRRRGAHHRPGRALAGPRGVCLHQPGRHARRRHSRANWARSGPAVPISRRRSRWMRRSSSRPSGRWFPRRCARSSAAARWSAPAST